MNDDDFLAAFESCSLPRSEWTHEAHVRMAWLYSVRHGPAEAIERARRGIRQLNGTYRRAAQKAAGLDSLPPDGYHDTITVAFVRIISARVVVDKPIDAFRDRNTDLFDRALGVLHCYYTKDRLNSLEAKELFLEPDLRRLPA